MNRRDAWVEALRLSDQLEKATASAAGGPGGGGWRDPRAAERRDQLRAKLDALVVEHGFEGTYVDPAGPSWAEQQRMGREYPGGVE